MKRGHTAGHSVTDRLENSPLGKAPAIQAGSAFASPRVPAVANGAVRPKQGSSFGNSGLGWSRRRSNRRCGPQTKQNPEDRTWRKTWHRFCAPTWHGLGLSSLPLGNSFTCALFGGSRLRISAGQQLSYHPQAISRLTLIYHKPRRLRVGAQARKVMPGPFPQTVH